MWSPVLGTTELSQDKEEGLLEHSLTGDRMCRKMDKARVMHPDRPARLENVGNHKDTHLPGIVTGTRKIKQLCHPMHKT